MWLPGEIAGIYLCQTKKQAKINEEIRVVGWGISGENCVRAWKSGLGSRENSCDSLEN